MSEHNFCQILALCSLHTRVYICHMKKPPSMRGQNRTPWVLQKLAGRMFLKTMSLGHVFLARVSQLQFGCRFLPCDVRQQLIEPCGCDPKRLGFFFLCPCAPGLLVRR